MAATNTTIDAIAGHAGREVAIRGWLHRRRSSGKIHFLTLRDGTGFVQAVVSKAGVGDEAFTRADHLGQETSLNRRGNRPEGRARAGRLRSGRIDAGGSRRIARLSNHAEGTRRRLPPRPAPPLDPQPAAGRDPAGAARGRRRHSGLPQRSWVHPGGYAHLHAGRLRRYHYPVRRAVLRPRDGVSHSERSALQRSQRHGAGAGLLLRTDVSRREVEDTTPPDRVLDGRAGDGLRHSG